MKAVKGNKEYSIDETQKKVYKDNGFDIYDEDGSVIEYGRGKTVSYEKYVQVEKELEKLKEQSGKEDNQDVIDILTAFAHEHEIDLGKAATITGIVKKIKEHKPEANGSEGSE